MNNHYQLYVESVFTLAETIVVKFDGAAQALNYQVTNTHGPSAVDDFDKTSWKYYQNISGLYHFSDAMIRVVSLDTGEVIDFTKDNLAIHLATKAAYAFGTRHYKELVGNHPGQEILILGILNPTPIEQAIEAKEGQILRWPAELVEPNETSLIPKLQRWIYQYLDRWVNKQFTLSDDLYVANYIGQLFLHLVQAIMSFRLEACKTREAHSFHVRQYLASHGALDVYLDKMTLSQALFFYRNILYIQRHAGKRDTFDWLVEHVMSERMLPLYEYTMAHNAKEMQRESTDDDAHLLPQIEFKRKGVNQYARSNDIIQYSLEDVLKKVNPLTVGNPQYNADHIEQMRDDFAYGKSSAVMTKMLESSVTDYSDAQVYTLADILLNHWLGMVGRKRFVANVVIQLPKTGDSIQLDAQHAVALYIYAVHQTVQADEGPQLDPLLYVPSFKVNRLARVTPPTLQELMAITTRPTLSQAEVQEMLSTAVNVPFIVSIEAFYNFALQVFQASSLQHAIYSSKEDYLARGQGQMIASRLYDDDTLTLQDLQDPDHPGRGLPYETLFEQIGLELDNYTGKDFYTLATLIAGAATGAASKPNNSLGDLQKAMVSLFAKLSSYSIQVVTEINASNIVVVENPMVRVSESSSKREESFYEYVTGATVEVIGVKSQESQIFNVELARIIAPVDISRFTHSFSHALDMTSRVRFPGGFVPTNPYQIESGLRISTDWNFEEQASNLTLEQRANLVDMYSDWTSSTIETTSKALVGFKLVSARPKSIAMRLVTNRKSLGVFTLYAKTQELHAFSFLSISRTLPRFTLVTRVKELEIFGAIEPPKITILNAFKLVNNKKQLPHVALTSRQETLNAFKQVGRSAQVDAFLYVGQRVELDPINAIGTMRVIDGFKLMPHTRELPGFDYAGGNIDSTDYNNSKNVTGFAPE